MSTNKLILPVSGFIRGLNTEASVLNVMPSEFMDGTTNIELLSNGSVRPRRGIDFFGASANGGILQTLRTSTVAAESLQESPQAVTVRLAAPNGTLLERVVIDLDNKFYIYETTRTAFQTIDAPYQTISRGTLATDDQKFYNMQFAQSGDKLFFAGLHCNPGYLSVGADNVTLEVTYIDVIVRDPDAAGINKRVSNNSKWYECIESHTSAALNEPGVGADWERYWFQLDGAVPAGPAAWVTATAYTTLLIKRYDKNATVASADTFPTTVEFYAGRLWLSGDPETPNQVLFSQVVDKDGKLVRFMQEADPFDAADPELVDGDGGIIYVQGAGLVKRLIAIKSSIFAGTSNGLWQIRGADDIFKATGYSSSKVLTDSLPGPNSAIQTGDTIIIFGQNNIWEAGVSKDATTTSVGETEFVSLSDNKITTLYNRIPLSSKASSTVLFNESTNRVYYFANVAKSAFDRNYGNKQQPGYFKSAIVLQREFAADDLLMQDTPQSRHVKSAWFLYEYADGGPTEQPYIAAPFIGKDVPLSDNIVIDLSTDTVVDSSGNTVVAGGDAEASDKVHFLALRRAKSGTVVTYYMAFGTLYATTGGVDFASDATYMSAYSGTVRTGVQTLGDVLHKKSATYMYFVFKKVETGVIDADGMDSNPGGCYLRTAWNFSVSSVSNKYSAQAQIYKPYRYNYTHSDGTDGLDHIWCKHRVRGKGNSLQVILETEVGKDFHLIGWSQQFYGKND